MNLLKTAAPLAAALALAACGGQTNEQAALENAAEQSTPEAAAVLEAAAENGANVQQAMQAAGNAQAETQAAPVAQGAKPHAPRDPVPPPKIPAPGGAGNASGTANSQ